MQSTHRLPQSHVIYIMNAMYLIEQVNAKTWDDVSKDNDDHFI